MRWQVAGKSMRSQSSRPVNSRRASITARLIAKYADSPSVRPGSPAVFEDLTALLFRQRFPGVALLVNVVKRYAKIERNRFAAGRLIAPDIIGHQTTVFVVD